MCRLQYNMKVCHKHYEHFERKKLRVVNNAMQTFEMKENACHQHNLLNERECTSKTANTMNANIE